jgi:hypothetical protein
MRRRCSRSCSEVRMRRRWRGGGEVEGVGEVQAGLGPVEGSGDEGGVFEGQVGEAGQGAQGRDDAGGW